MAREGKRGCGYRKVGALYVVGTGTHIGCDRLPYEIEYCPTCGAGIKFSRGFQWLDGYKFFGKHQVCIDQHVCYICDPVLNRKYGLLWVGEAYYSTQSFIEEAIRMGVSKRIANIPKELELGVTPILLAHKKGVLKATDEGEEWFPAIFYAFIPTAIEMPIWESELNDERKDELEKKGITPISIPDGDPDHASDSDNVKVILDLETMQFKRIIVEGE